jgi:hypothetical protein
MAVLIVARMMEVIVGPVVAAGHRRLLVDHQVNNLLE